MSREKLQCIAEVPYTPNLLLQVLMFCNVYLSAAWAGVYGFYILYNVSSVKSFHIYVKLN